MGVLKERSLKTLLTDLKDWFALKAKTVFSVNETEPVNGNVTIKQVDLANNLSSDKTQQSDGEFIIRTSGGHASIEDGDAFVLRILGNRVHNDYVPEELNMTVIPIPRVAPDPITAVIDNAIFEAYVETAGTYTLTYDNGWSAAPATYGITVSGTPLDGDEISIVWDGVDDPVMTVTAPRTAPDPITATIDRDTFVAYVIQSGTITLTYTTAWSADPSLYGITVVGDPVGGDQIVVVYVKEDRGTIVQATPSALKSTGWNLYNHALGYAVVTKYSETYGFRIGGTYSAISFSTTPSGTQESITPVDGMFTIPSDGFIHVLGGNATDTYIINAWSDWTEGYVGEFKAYEESVVDISAAMTAYFPYGLMRVADVRDEINLNTLTAISRIGRMAYTAENIASAKASGRAYEADTNYIYIVKAVEDVNAIAVDGSYVVNDHGNEIFYGSNVPVYLETLYGNNLKNKLERDVVQISQQTLTSAQQAQVRTNIGAASQSSVNALNTDKAQYVDLGNIEANDDYDAIRKAFDKITTKDKTVNVKFGYSGQWCGYAYKYSSGPYGMMMIMQYNDNQDYVLHKTGENSYIIRKLAKYDSVAPAINRVQSLTNGRSSQFQVLLPRSTGWLCGLLICNTNGGGNGVYYCDLQGTTFSATKIVSNQGNNTVISGSLNDKTLTLTASLGSTSIQFDYATWIGLY